MKKLISLILVFVLLLSFFVGCAKNETETDSAAGKDNMTAAATETGAIAESPVKDEEYPSFSGDPSLKDGVKEYSLSPEIAYDRSSISGSDSITVSPEPYVPSDGDTGRVNEITAEPFVLTAGEWNDLNNWAFFSNLVSGEKITFPSFGLDPTRRIAVTLTNEGAPVANAKVALMSGDETVWKAVTDKDGRAYLFCGSSTELSIKVEGSEEETQITLQGVSGSAQDRDGEFKVITNEENIEVPLESKKYGKTEVMFILDTTGSMGDEIAYLQKDFSSIVGDVAHEGMTFSVNFYRDDGDVYVTKCSGFTSDASEVQTLLNAERADGGGDTPEAVAQILRETLLDAQWSEDSNKIAFLIFDAPPHHGTQEYEMISEAVKAAAAKGIRVVPVVASNADRETELFGRAVAIMTDANYVFLTDDSGVGDSHLEPIVGAYEVELLHDIIVRNIKNVEE